MRDDVVADDDDFDFVSAALVVAVVVFAAAAAAASFVVFVLDPLWLLSGMKTTKTRILLVGGCIDCKRAVVVAHRVFFFFFVEVGSFLKTKNERVIIPGELLVVEMLLLNNFSS